MVPLYDTRVRMTTPNGLDERIVILDIDEKSLGEIGRWPWSRNLMAELTEKLFERYGVAVVGFDVVWAERDPSSGIEVLDTLARGEPEGALGRPRRSMSQLGTQGSCCRSPRRC